MKKKIVVSVLAFFMMLTVQVFAQNKKNKKQKIVFDVSMSCENCKKRIEKEIAFEKGVTDMKVNLPAGTVMVEFREDRTDTLKLKKVIEKLGYTVAVHSPQTKK